MDWFRMGLACQNPKDRREENLKYGTERKSKGHMEEARKIAEGTADAIGQELDGVPKGPATSLKLVGKGQELHCRNLGQSDRDCLHKSVWR